MLERRKDDTIRQDIRQIRYVRHGGKKVAPLLRVCGIPHCTWLSFVEKPEGKPIVGRPTKNTEKPTFLILKDDSILRTQHHTNRLARKVRRLYEGLKLYYNRFSSRHGPGIFHNSANNRGSWSRESIAWRPVSCEMTCYHIPDKITLYSGFQRKRPGWNSSFFFFFVRSQIAVKSSLRAAFGLRRMRDVLTNEHMAWCNGGRREAFAVQN